MHRRTLLASLGGMLATTALAGCMSADGNPGDQMPTATPRNQPTTSGSSFPTANQDDESSRPADGVTPDPMPVDLSGIECPTIREDADLRICSTTTDLDDAPVALVPPRPPHFAPTTDDDTIETFEFDLRNQSDTTFGFNPYDWSIERHTDDGWVHVAPEMTPEPWTQLAPGESYTFALSVESVPNQKIDGSRSIVLDLDSGVYALVVDGQLERGKESGRVECAAVFAVERDEN